jgi:hypothetical protein
VAARDPGSEPRAAAPEGDDELDLYGPFRRLLPVHHEGRVLWMPEGNSVLRGLQYVETRTGAVHLAWGRYCWNDTVGCCELRYRSAPGEEEATGRACRLPVASGLELVTLPRGGRARARGAAT